MMTQKTVPAPPKIITDIHRVSPENLSAFSLPWARVSDAYKDWCRAFMEPKQCFSNAMNLSLLEGMSTVIGVVMVRGFPVEHAWNIKKGEGYDMTFALFNAQQEEKVEYYSLHTFSPAETAILYGENKGIDFFALQKDARYQHLFAD